MSYLDTIRAAVPEAPWDIKEAVELYAREHDRTGSIHFFPIANTWVVKLSLRPNDERMKAYQEGRASEPEAEMVWIHELKKGGQPFEFVPLDIRQMGAEGVRTFLQRGNLFSGRGQYTSLKDSMTKARHATHYAKQETKERARDSALAFAKDRRRTILGIPLLPVGTDLKRNEE